MMKRMEFKLDLEEEAKAADLLAVHLEKVDAPQKLIDQARQHGVELRLLAESQRKTESS
jgi:pentose-5-phosphate-3-epimerase